MIPEKMMELKRWAVVGVKPDEDQYAYMIFKILKVKGYTVYPVNPRYDKIDEYICYHSVSEIPEEIDVVDMVVNPGIGEKLIDDIYKRHIKYLWLQPGSYDDEFIEKIESKGFTYVKDCILERLRLKG